MKNDVFGERDGTRQLVLITVLIAVLVSSIAIAALSTSPSRSSGTAGQDSDTRGIRPTEGLDRLHAAGVTGSNVTIGVVDVTGFDTEHPTLDDRIVAGRSFSEGETIENGGRNAHGTATATLVARTAPDANLYLASFGTGDGFRDAVGWLVREDVDVIVAPVEFYGKPGDGSARVARVASRATEHGVVFVTPAGNLGRGHWQGQFDPTDNGAHRFDSGTRNYLEGDGQKLALWSSWERQATEYDFTVELYRSNGTGARLVARSRPYAGDGVPNERIVARVDPQGTYYYVVRGPANATNVRIEVSSPTHAFRFRERAGSIVAPATGHEVVSVGAYDSRSGQVAPYSSAGPIGGGRPGVDVVASDRLRAPGWPREFVGTSATAPYVAGVTALVLDVDAELEPQEVESILERTASDVGPPGDDPIAGSGLVQPDRAVRLARNASKT